MLLILSGPSGAGKTTLADYLLQQIPALSFVATFTTRAPRDGERPGRDYNFVSPGEFSKKKEANGFIETNFYNDNWYGVPNDFVAREKSGEHFVVVPDVNGAIDIVKLVPRAIAVWVTAPEAMLRERLEARGSESAEKIEARLQRARDEEKEAHKSGVYKKVVINKVLGETKEVLLTLAQISLGEKK